jgi:hypothetical protein
MLIIFLQDGMTHAFVLTFKNKEDRDYYVDHDPVHEQFKQEAAGLKMRVLVIDYTPSIF